MKRIWTLSAMLFLLIGLLGLSPLARAEASSAFSPPEQDSATETPQPSLPTAGEIIAAVNNLRASRGLNILTTNSILMQVAADQASALAASNGAIGHERPCGMTLGQDLLRRGFPLAGALSLDGYRSENWGTAYTAEEAIRMWLGDEPHTDTMVDPNRSDIGAAVAVSDQTYVVLETALSTASGQMQYEAAGILTGIPMTVTACYGESTQYAENSLLPQYSIPVARATALPNGEVIHEVKYGQALWSIAIQYGTTIDDLRRLNNLPATPVIYPGQKLIVMKGATQPPPDAALTPTLPAANVAYDFIVTPIATYTAISTGAPQSPVTTGDFVRQNGMAIGILIFSFAVLLIGFGILGRRRH
ncbi:MAG: LysM peptidoglycan-binding domain-containing protein [Anaerolineaceae bacterium]|nr:MAG: LysM peptidoglycan-binding domain-containing protein [Anaerolineaceae bacterium]